MKSCAYCSNEFHRSENMRTHEWDKKKYCSRLCALKAIDKDPTKTLEDRFWIKVFVPQDTNKCWIWIGSKDKSGYGRLNVKNTPQLAHRISWQIHKGIIDAKMVCRHICDNPSCVNPNHLKLGTQRENVIDCKDRKRQGDKGSTNGQDHYCAKFTNNEVRLIRMCYESGKSAREIAQVISVKTETVTAIVKRKTYKRIK